MPLCLEWGGKREEKDLRKEVGGEARTFVAGTLALGLGIWYISIAWDGGGGIFVCLLRRTLVDSP